ncbi:hypothetical protein [Clostridium polynesiense]|uniref:hypothetical protein n=1 Tax=Clostridium polynesiense TaxID=1325933 RepID=UPI00059059C6|nr:hypothetical protein [Clostridium polynesiense]
MIIYSKNFIAGNGQCAMICCEIKVKIVNVKIRAAAQGTDNSSLCSGFSYNTMEKNGLNHDGYDIMWFIKINY